MAQVKFCHLGWYRHLVRPMDYLICYAPRLTGALSDTAIRLSVCPSVSYSTLAAWRRCLGYRHAACLQLVSFATV